MHSRFVKPLAFAVALALSAGSAFAASSFDVGDIDKSISPCADFNGFVNAKWVAANPIPPDRTRWGAFDQLREHSLETQHSIAEKAAKDADHAKAGSIEQKIGWFYRSGMDDAAVEKAGWNPIKPDLDRIGAMKSTSDIVAWIGDAAARAIDPRTEMTRPNELTGAGLNIFLAVTAALCFVFEYAGCLLDKLLSANGRGLVSWSGRPVRAHTSHSAIF